MFARRSPSSAALVFLSLFVAPLGGCSSSASGSAPDGAPAPVAPVPVGPIAATMNDVSILFPLPASLADKDELLSASAEGARGELLPTSLYGATGPILGSFSDGDAGVTFDGEGARLVGTSSAAAYSTLQVVAMRLDPCFAVTHPDPTGAGCTAQLRLIFQAPLYADPAAGGGPAQPTGANDSALHAFYDLTRDELLSLAAALVALREKNQGRLQLGPLAPSPIMVAQGLRGAYAEGVRALITQYAGSQNLARVAVASSLVSAGGFLWTFFANDIVDGRPVPSAIPTLPDDDGGAVTSQTAGAVGAWATIGNQFFLAPETTSPDDFSALFDEDAGAGAAAKAFDGLVRVENPEDITANTMDCGSCHVATPAAVGVARPRFGDDDRTSPLAFQPSGPAVTAADMAPSYGVPPGGPINIHNFSYSGSVAGIAQRTVNETAAVVDYLRSLPR